MKFSAQRALTALLTVAALSLPVVTNAPALAGPKSPGGDYGSYQYDAYLEREAKAQRQRTARAQSRDPGGQRVYIGASEFDEAQAGPDRVRGGPWRFLYNVRPDQEQHYRGN
ncbi:MAG: hypothetical protein ACE5GS_03685 [Kiloniellaceae bacterium]